MPFQIPIRMIPNQDLTINLDGNLFDISLRKTNGIMSASMVINSVLTLSNLHVAAGALIIPSKYQEAGNFIFLTGNFEVPDYVRFNITQYLVYFTAAELAVYRLPPTPPITSEFFNPIADLPLRFKPAGYTHV